MVRLSDNEIEKMIRWATTPDSYQAGRRRLAPYLPVPWQPGGL